MEIPRDPGGYARPNRPRQEVTSPAQGPESGSAALHRPLPPPVPVTTQVLPLALLSEVRPRERPIGFVAEKGYGAALGIVRD